MNSRTQAVPLFDPTSFYEKVSFGFGKEARILEAEAVNVVPEDLLVELRTKKGRVELEPLLLNTRDSIRFKIIVSNFSGDLDIRGRVAGVKRIVNTYKLQLETYLTPRQQLKEAIAMFVMWLVGAVMILLGLASFFGESPAYFQGVSIMLIGFSGWFISIVSKLNPNLLLLSIFLFLCVMTISVYTNWFLGTPI